ncbi:uncharacterized protein LOC129599672 [Paramacrobiotus metropolitanus]|uniref:uncharacterized protein LOC129599672 n=1 Tax=Paramacrobiotus metropolitanus TaxID=2943436 RepID=UPI0024462FDA|nr:uncharacterized protein LOC129599672 [Paramacrobiotus metropolitanus]XP_055353956.1 uncharacterized protein LOC129599672 [Paramacrobiotus metropolitanus]
MDAKRKKKVLSMFDAGCTVRQIRKETRISRDALSSLLKASDRSFHQRDNSAIRPITDEQRRQILELFDAGCTRQQIMEQVGVHTQGVRRVLAQAGLSLTQRNRSAFWQSSATPEQRERICQMFDEGCSREQIAKSIGMAEGQLDRELALAGKIVHSASQHVMEKFLRDKRAVESKAGPSSGSGGSLPKDADREYSPRVTRRRASNCATNTVQSTSVTEDTAQPGSGTESLEETEDEKMEEDSNKEEKGTQNAEDEKMEEDSDKEETGTQNEEDGKMKEDSNTEENGMQNAEEGKMEDSNKEEKATTNAEDGEMNEDPGKEEKGAQNPEDGETEEDSNKEEKGAESDAAPSGKLSTFDDFFGGEFHLEAMATRVGVPVQTVRETLVSSTNVPA